MFHPTRAAIATASPFVTSAGARIARQGGNAVDIAAAAALVATVSEILMCSLGGSAFLMIRFPGQAPELIDGADLLPQASRPPIQESTACRKVHLPYGDGIDVMVGHATVGVPGMLAAVDLAWRRHGCLPWSEIVAPALELARANIPTSPTLAQWLIIAGHHILSQQEAARQCFFREDGQPLEEGNLFRVPHLDKTWECLSREGARAFYEGDLAAAFTKEMTQHGGLVTREDLASYRAKVRQPLVLSSGGFELALNPPPAVGGTAVGFLIRLLDMGWKPKRSKADQALVQAQAQSCLLNVGQKTLRHSSLDEGIAKELMDAQVIRQHLEALHSPNTTHLSVVTDDGAMVAVTMSMGYGSGVLIPETGIACNNSLGEPEMNPQGYHAASPGSRLISNMAPTVAWHQDGCCLALGSPGASRITTAIGQTWARYILEGMTFEEAVKAPRLHIEPYQNVLRAQCEPGIDTSLLPPQFVVRPFDGPDMYFGAIKLAALDEHHRFHAVADERRPGSVEIV
jgi:gamma-glutamyltranspeptidase/glutathione hydrolase